MRRFLFQTLLMVWIFTTAFAWMVVIVFTVGQEFSGPYALWLLAALILPWFRLVIKWIFPQDTYAYDPKTSTYNGDIALKDVTLRTFFIGIILLVWMLSNAFAWSMVVISIQVQRYSGYFWLSLLIALTLTGLVFVIKHKYPKGIFYDPNTQK